MDELRSKSLGDFQQIQKSLVSRIRSLENEIKEYAKNVLQEIQDQGFEFEDFPSGTLPNHFKKISDGVFEARVLYSNQLEQKLIDNKILYAKDDRDSTALSGMVLERYLTIKRAVYQLDFFKNSYGNIVPMTVLNEIAKEIKNIEMERDLIPISSLNTILSKEIRNQPVPFIYERLGEKYRHYFIDEFQDTSKMQWTIWSPLLEMRSRGRTKGMKEGLFFLLGM